LMYIEFRFEMTFGQAKTDPCRRHMRMSYLCQIEMSG
jgi:hypothetical protein